jgi:hypothetical protein
MPEYFAPMPDIGMALERIGPGSKGSLFAERLKTCES